MVALLVTTSAPRGLQAAVDQREMRAREAFAVGKYQDALDLFAKLYAEKLHPNYLRNIGRCYQNLGEPDKAINSFREYLRKARTVSADERQEVEGYIQEMEDLKAKQQASIATPPPPPQGGITDAPPTGSTSTAVTTGTTAGSTSSPGTLPGLTPTTMATEPAGTDLTVGNTTAGSSDAPVYGRWWFWAIVVGVVGAGLGVAAAAGAFTKTENATCPTGTRC